jgi:hypothetical protein
VTLNCNLFAGQNAEQSVEPIIAIPCMPRGEESKMPPTIKEVKKRHESRLLQLPGVVSVGIGKDKNDIPTIVVGLKSSNPDTESRLPTRLEGYPVQVRYVGAVKIGGPQVFHFR